MAAPSTPEPAPPGRPSRGPLVALVLLLLAVIAAGAWWWWQQSQREAAEAERRARLAAAEARNQALRDQIAALGPADPASCPPGEVLQPRPGAATLPPATPASGAASVPTAAGPGPEARPLGDAGLARTLEQATAMVIVVDNGKLSTGTGFFIAPTLFVTNRHVVEAARQQVLLTSAALKTVRRATVVHATSNSNVGSPDFALLRLDEGSAPGTLSAALEVSKLTPVVAAGFPGVVVENDVRFRRLLAGDRAAAPDLNLTQGAVQSLQSGTGGLPLIVHTASIAKGNSGGPLVDACGRLVGINTFINVDQSQSAKINYAIRSEAMQAFLQSAGSVATLDPRPCARG